MKFDNQRAFTHPVLRKNNDDYIEGSFKTNIKIDDVKKTTSTIKVTISFDLDIDEINLLFSENLIEYVVVCVCVKSFYRESFMFNKAKENIIEIKKEYCRDTIKFESYIVAKEKIKRFKCNKINKEFVQKEFTFEQGTVLAQNQEIDFICRNEKFKNLQSLLRFEVDANLNVGQWNFDIDLDHPRIKVSSDQYKIIDENKRLKVVFANTFLPMIVMELIEKFENEDYEWCQLIREKIYEIDPNFSSDDDLPYYKKLEICQKILKNPLKDLNKHIKQVARSES